MNHRITTMTQLRKRDENAEAGLVLRRRVSSQEAVEGVSEGTAGELAKEGDKRAEKEKARTRLLSQAP
jgi:hypothetical protein